MRFAFPQLLETWQPVLNAALTAANLSFAFSILPREAFEADIFLSLKQHKINYYSALSHSAAASLLFSL